MTETDAAGTDGSTRGLGGRRFVLFLYLALVCVSGVLGVLFTVAVDDPSPPALFFLVELPATALGFGLYGALTVAVVLGLPLLLVVAVSERVDDVDAVGRADGVGADDGVGAGDDDAGDDDDADTRDDGDAPTGSVPDAGGDATATSTGCPKD